MLSFGVMLSAVMYLAAMYSRKPHRIIRELAEELHFLYRGGHKASGTYRNVPVTISAIYAEDGSEFIEIALQIKSPFKASLCDGSYLKAARLHNLLEHVESGDSEFDGRFAAVCNDSSQAVYFFASEKVRSLFRSLFNEGGSSWQLDFDEIVYLVSFTSIKNFRRNLDDLCDIAEYLPAPGDESLLTRITRSLPDFSYACFSTLFLLGVMANIYIILSLADIFSFYPAFTVKSIYQLTVGAVIFSLLYLLLILAINSMKKREREKKLLLMAPFVLAGSLICLLLLSSLIAALADNRTGGFAVTAEAERLQKQIFEKKKQVLAEIGSTRTEEIEPSY